MNISNLINEDRIIFDNRIQTKQLLFEKVAEVLVKEGSITNSKNLSVTYIIEKKKLPLELRRVLAFLMQKVNT